MNEEDIFEMCECGHVGGSSPAIYNMHEAQLVNGKVVARGHGECKCNAPEHVDKPTLCSCEKFLWVKFCDKDGNDIDDDIMKGVIHKKAIEREMTLIRTRQLQYKHGEISKDI